MFLDILYADALSATEHSETRMPKGFAGFLFFSSHHLSYHSAMTGTKVTASR